MQGLLRNFASREDKGCKPLRVVMFAYFHHARHTPCLPTIPLPFVITAALPAAPVPATASAVFLTAAASMAASLALACASLPC
eukprot:1150633-Pelagomonas_calceolata.AAC.4